MSDEKDWLALASEDALAARMRYERESRYWSAETLAREMTKVGCPMNQSGIWKIENGQPRRKITVDEAIAMARVFEMSLEQLLLPVDRELGIAQAERLAAQIHRWMDRTPGSEHLRVVLESLDGVIESLGADEQLLAVRESSLQAIRAVIDDLASLVREWSADPLADESRRRTRKARSK